VHSSTFCSNCPSDVDGNSDVSVVNFCNASSDYPYKENMNREISVLHFTARNQLSITTCFFHKTHLNEGNGIYDIVKSVQLKGLMCVFSFCWKVMKFTLVIN
jgi:hypothetical protein